MLYQGNLKLLGSLFESSFHNLVHMGQELVFSVTPRVMRYTGASLIFASFNVEADSVFHYMLCSDGGRIW